MDYNSKIRPLPSCANNRDKNALSRIFQNSGAPLLEILSIQPSPPHFQMEQPLRGGDLEGGWGGGGGGRRKSPYRDEKYAALTPSDYRSEGIPSL